MTKIPADMTLETAAAVLCPGVTAYHSLINVARLSKGEKVLIHSGAGATGQMAIHIAQMIGAEVFTTVGYSDKKSLLIQTFGLADDHIFYSRSTAFSTGIKRITQGYGVDVVLNSLSGDGLRASWDCIAPYGRFIEIGKADILANASIPMGNFQKNVSYSAVDIDHILKTKRSLASDLRRDVINLTAKGTISPPTPIHWFSVGEVERAFRYFQSGRNTGRTMIKPMESALVQVSSARLGYEKVLTQFQTYTKSQSTWTFDSNASYLVAGGLGGVGRAILLWMVQKGAKCLIVPSRSGISSKAASEVVALIQRQNVQIFTPRCDVSSMESLSDALETCAKNSPPIKGCINASLVLQVCLPRL